MKKAILMLAASMALALSPIADNAQAATKKKPVPTKKHGKAKAKPVAKTIKHRPAKRAEAELPEDTQNLVVQSSAALVADQSSGTVLYEKNAGAVVPIASITKLMTAMVALDAQPSLTEMLTVGEDDVDMLKGTRSRLAVGTQLSREDMLRLALMASENRAAHALARHYPGGSPAFVAAMNRKAQDLGMTDTRFEDPTGLTAANVSSARDLTRLVAEAHQYPLIREFTTSTEHEVTIRGRAQAFHNTNRLVSSPTWEIGLSKTGYIAEAGKCLVMQAWVNNKPMIIVLLDSWGKLTRIGDANRIKRWIESAGLAGRPSAG